LYFSSLAAAAHKSAPRRDLTAGAELAYVTGVRRQERADAKSNER
jgi:hypothetical protein